MTFNDVAYEQKTTIQESEWVEWSLGIFLLSSPKKVEKNNCVYRDVDAFDGLQILTDDKFDYRFYALQGANYVDEVKRILTEIGITKINIETTIETLGVTREWEPNTEKLTVINELLKDINYTQLWIDEWGYYTASKYKTPQQRANEYIYKDDALSIIYNGVEETLDLFNVPNKWTVAVSNFDTAPLSATYINNNENSPTSYVNRDRYIVDYRTINYIASQEALNNYVQRVAFEASQIYGTVAFNTAIMPMHSFNDVLYLQYSALGIADKYEEISWTLPLSIGGQMKHEVRKVVEI